MIHFYTSTDNAFALAHDAHSSGRYDKSHALSHTQGGLEGGPNYFKQKCSVNQRRSGADKLWRDIKTYLAASADASHSCA